MRIFHGYISRRSAYTAVKQIFEICLMRGKSYIRTQDTVRDRVAQSATCLATDTCLTAQIQGWADLVWSHTFLKINHEIISTVILLPSTDSFKEGCRQLPTTVHVCARVTG